MLKIEGPGLEGLREAIGATGQGSQFTELPDGVVDQVLDVGPIIRRGRTPAGSSGIFTAEIANVHVAGALVATEIDPYSAGSAVSGYPTPIPPGFDVWLLQSWAWFSSGAALIDAQLAVNQPATRFAFSGAAQAITQPIRSYHIATLSSLSIAGVTCYRSIGDGLIGARHPYRIPRGATIQWVTNNAAAAANYRVDLLLGVFPAGFGQDVCE